MICCSIALENLKLGLSVIADSVNPISIDEAVDMLMSFISQKNLITNLRSL